METLHWYEQEKSNLQRVENGVISDFDYHMEILEEYYQTELDAYADTHYYETFFECGYESGMESGYDSAVENMRDNATANEDGEWFFDKWKDLSLLDQGRIAVMFGMGKAELETRFHNALER